MQAQVHAQETDLSRRVQEWDDRIRPKLVEEVCVCVSVSVYFGCKWLCVYFMCTNGHSS